jgi:superfamily II DNA/RNA helicase
MENFKRGRVDILVATDLAARGIDVEDVQQVINYDCPKLISEYEHRIGRTGRCKKRGMATTLITPDDEEILPDLKTFLERNKQVVPVELKKHTRVKLAEEYIT